MKTSQASPPCRQGVRYCPEQAEPPIPPRCWLQLSIPCRQGRELETPRLRCGVWSDRIALGEGCISVPPLPSALGFGYRRRSLGNFCFVFLGGSHLDAVRAGSCAPLCRWECKITPGESTQLRGSRSCKPGFCTWGAWTEKLLFLASSGHPFPGRSASQRFPVHP